MKLTKLFKQQVATTHALIEEVERLNKELRESKNLLKKANLRLQSNGEVARKSNDLITKLMKENFDQCLKCDAKKESADEAKAEEQHDNIEDNETKAD
jgi:hypothetical protein